MSRLFHLPPLNVKFCHSVTGVNGTENSAQGVRFVDSSGSSRIKRNLADVGFPSIRRQLLVTQLMV
jgi:hypothetical protein